MEPPVPLTASEREELRQLASVRLAKVDARTADLFAFRPLERPMTIVNSALYWLFGLDPETIPDAYMTDPAVMTAFQERNQLEQLRAIEDDFVPYVMPWFGTVVGASALGCKIEFVSRQDPAADPTYYPVQTPDDIARLRVADPSTSGMMPTVLEFLRYMRENSVLPVGITDFQGPLTTANQLMGYDKLMYLMYDDPKAAHMLMDVVTDSLIGWVRAQKAVIGEPLDYCISDQQVYMGSQGGVWFSDDDAVLISADLYREFVVPYNSRILTAFGGGAIHYCGNATHHIENFMATEGLRALNIYALHNIKSITDMQRGLQDKVVLFVCDFTPVDYETYFDELLAGVDPRGTVICSQYSPVVGLLPGAKYNAIRRPLIEGRNQVHETLQAKIDARHGLS
jgi:uroporphyrinogen-III decarboxylase